MIATLMTAHSDNRDWLEPERPICDPHRHLWIFRTGATHTRCLPHKMAADLAPPALDGGHNIRSTVYIERAELLNDTATQVYRL